MTSRLIRTVKGNRKVFTIIAAVIAVISLIAVTIIVLPSSPNSDDTAESIDVSSTPVSPDIDNEDDKESSIVKEVTDATIERLDQGTILAFGNPEAETTISIISDPSRIAQGTDYESESILSAVEEGKIRFNLYLSPDGESSVPGTNSMVQTATCLIGVDEDPHNSMTLRSIISASNDFNGQEDLTEMSEKMGTSTDIECSDTAADSSTSTQNNALHFKAHFQLDESNALVTSSGALTNPTNLKDGWLTEIIDGKSINEVIE